MALVHVLYNRANSFSQVCIKKLPSSTCLTLNAKCTDEFGVCLTHGIGGYSADSVLNVSDKS